MHEGGTKFYEVVQLYNADARKFILVKRWGKAAARVRGGEIKVEEFSTAQRLDAAADKVIREKQGRGYSATKPDAAGALHTRGGSSFASETDFGNTLSMHYGPNGTRIREVLGLSLGAVNPDDDDDDEVVVEEPQPEPDRGETWGSW